MSAKNPPEASWYLSKHLSVWILNQHYIYSAPPVPCACSLSHSVETERRKARRIAARGAAETQFYYVQSAAFLKQVNKYLNTNFYNVKRELFVQRHAEAIFRFLI